MAKLVLDVSLLFQNKVFLMKNNLSFVRDKHCHLSLCLHQTEPHYNTTALLKMQQIGWFISEERHPQLQSTFLPPITNRLLVWRERGWRRRKKKKKRTSNRYFGWRREVLAAPKKMLNLAWRLEESEEEGGGRWEEGEPWVWGATKREGGSIGNIGWPPVNFFPPVKWLVCRWAILIEPISSFSKTNKINSYR